MAHEQLIDQLTITHGSMNQYYVLSKFKKKVLCIILNLAVNISCRSTVENCQKFRGNPAWFFHSSKLTQETILKDFPEDDLLDFKIWH